jgi:hypothetical protein
MEKSKSLERCRPYAFSGLIRENLSCTLFIHSIFSNLRVQLSVIMLDRVLKQYLISFNFYESILFLYRIAFAIGQYKSVPV